MKINNKYLDGAKVMLGAHRGDRKNYPENTMPAFISAVNMGCEAIETDVRTTKDGHLVLIHDRDVKRTTNGEGFVDQMTLEELRALDAGSWKGEEFIGVKIPTVREFVEYVSKTDLVINWELKEYPADLGEEHAFACIDKLVELIDEFGLAERSFMNSFSERCLEYAFDKWPGKFAIHSYLDYKRPADHATKPLVSFSHWAGIWNKDENHVSGFKADYDYMSDNDIIPCILVPDTVEAYKDALDMGCRMFTSDDPAKGIEVLKELGER